MGSGMKAGRLICILSALWLGTSAQALVCEYSAGNGTSVFTFSEGTATIEIKLGTSVVGGMAFQCGPEACSNAQDLGEKGGPLYHVLQVFEDRSEVIYAVHHEHFPARSIIQIYRVTCEAS